MPSKRQTIDRKGEAGKRDPQFSLMRNDQKEERILGEITSAWVNFKVTGLFIPQPTALATVPGLSRVPIGV